MWVKDFMWLKNFSVAIGILAGTAGVTNSGLGIYRQLVVEPRRNEQYNRSIIKETPLLAETVEIEPDPGIAMRVEVTVKVFKTGDILVESGAKRRFIPFKLEAIAASLNPLAAVALAAEETTVIDGVEYEVEVLKYIETTKILPNNRLQRVRKFADGTVETAVIDMRSNNVLETKTEKSSLTDAEKQAIEKSVYKKRIFKKK